MRNYQFTVIVQQDEEGNYLAICPALQGCYAEGETPEEALGYLREVIQLHIEDRQARQEPIYEELFSQRLDIAA
ncbi:type II toxin-antitoxin system HicB family antitoxin [Spirosoma sp. HMF4905]|uniref:Type II toxin-antitoxin system HicB family antitoxin n=1 Tax=Spirosoma arboris TaxID=2682092 RepID=A0A7K1SDD5_9BACT|nr:type II toxin-antitoxin system HicB family antitoxin [Spirosoma arboris]MVM31824.1 type II toxin-antitoxin system HicB family antitoxin [Spirosoma arboris]